MAQPTANKVRLWREELQDPLAPQRRPPRALRIFLVLALMTALVGLFLGILLWVKPAPGPLFIPLAVTHYDAVQIPDVPYALQDQQSLGNYRLFKNEQADALSSQQAHQILTRLEELESQSEAVVVFVSARALRGSSGDVLLLPADADPNNPATFIPLAHVLDLLKKCPSSNKLLILDIAHGPANLRLGDLGADVAAALPAAVEAAEDPSLLVLCSCSPGQVSLSSEALGRSVFAHYLEQGLRGWADGFVDAARKDGRVSVTELAAYVTEKVDRWAKLNRDTRQVPMLLGQGRSFPLRIFTDAERDEPVKLPSAPEYPKWLQEAAKTANSTYSDGSYRLTPYLFRHQTALLVQAEQLWRGGTPMEQIQGREMAAFAQMQGLLPKKRSFAQPQPHSLALALKLQGKAPLLIGKDLDHLLTEWKKAGEAAKPEQIKEARDKLLATFQDKQKGKDFVPLAQAIFTRATELEAPTPEEIALLNGLIEAAAPDKKPQYLELVLLQQLAKLAEGKKTAWLAPAVQQMLTVVGQGERASASLLAFPWNRDHLDAAAQARHDGEIRFWAKDYASLDEAAQLLTSASSGYQSVLSTGSALDLARQTLDEATYFLPGYVSYLGTRPENEPDWLEAVRSATQLYETYLEPVAAAAQVSARVKKLSPLVASLRQKLDQLRKPFTADAVKHLIAVSQESRAKPATLNEIGLILNTPFVAAEERVKLWQAGLDLARRLQQKTLDLDEQDHRAGQMAGQRVPFDAARATEHAAAQSQKRGQWQLALLQLAGLNDDSQARLQKALSKTGADAALKVGPMLQRAWVKELRDQYLEEGDPAVRDRLIRFFPPLDGPPGLQADQPSDAAQVLALAGKQLWAWLAERHQYQARDYQGSGLDSPAVSILGEFHTKAASAYQQFTPPQPEKYAQLKIAKPVPILTVQRPSADSALEINVTGIDKQQAAGVSLDMIHPTKGWLEVSPRSLLLSKLSPDPVNPALLTMNLPVQVKMLDTAQYAPFPPPLGFMAEVRLGKKSFHRAVKVPLRSAADQLQIVLSTNAQVPDPPLDAVRLRPGKVPQTYYAFLYNPGPDARKVVVQVLVNDEVLKGGEAALTVMPKESKRIPLGAGAVPAPKDGTPPPKEPAPGGKEVAVPAREPLPPLKGSLKVRVLDGEDKTLLLTMQPVEVGIAHPREYVTVSEVKFDPAAPRNQEKNQLSVSLQPLVTLPGPDIPVELELPPLRIPALLAIKDGMFKGSLKPAATEPPPTAKLFAKEIQLAEEADLEGVFYVHVDGYKRSFIYRTVLARSGDPLTPKMFLSPEVRFATKAFVQASAKFAITMEVNNAPDNATLQVLLGRDEAGKFLTDVTEKFAAPKNRYIGFVLDPASGGLVFEASVEDWQVPLDTSKIRGQRKIIATLRDEFGKVLAHNEQVLTIDDTPPEKVRFLKFPAKAKKGAKVLVRATGSDPESGIMEAVFFAGAAEGGKAPPKTPVVQGIPMDKSGLVWEAELPLPEDKKGPTEITVVMVNKVGLTNYDTVKVELMDTDPATTGPGAIKGKVMFGELPQPNLDVFLYDDKGKPLNKTKSKDDGGFEFGPLKPGEYILYSLNKGSKRDGSEKVQVMANKTAEVTIKLKLK